MSGGRPPSLRVALVQLRVAEGDKARNLAAAGAAVTAAARAGADLVVLPEYVLTGFVAERMAELAEPLDGPSAGAFARMAAEHRVALVAGLPRLGDGDADGSRPDDVFDTTIALGADGELLSVYDKTHLFSSERAVFTPGAALQPPFTLRGVRFGVLCCFDIEFPEAARRLALGGAQCLVVPSANMVPWGGHHRVFVRSRALENHVFVAYANATGADSRYTYEGQSCLVDPLGRVLCDAGTVETVVWADADLSVVDEARAVVDYLSERRPELYL